MLLSWTLWLGKSPFRWPSSCSFLGLFLVFKFRWTSGFVSGLLAGTSCPFLVTRPDPAKLTFWIWGNTWLLIASFMALWIWILTEIIISSISLDIREFSSLDNLFISAWEHISAESAFVLTLEFIWLEYELSPSFSRLLLATYSCLLIEVLSKLSFLSVPLKWFHLT